MCFFGSGEVAVTAVSDLVAESFPKAALSFCNAFSDCVIGLAHCVRESAATVAGIDAVPGPEKESDIDKCAFVMPVIGV